MSPDSNGGSKPRLLDLFCGAGGASVGYSRAGFEVVGVDIKPQPNYPFEFHRCDALLYLAEMNDYDTRGGTGIRSFDAIHASPPCQRFARISAVHGRAHEHEDLVASTRSLLQDTGLPYVIENVMEAPLQDATLLCGAAFGLGATGTKDGKWRPLRRHRLFEASFFLQSMGCACDGTEAVGVYGGGGPQHKTVRNGGVNRGYMGDRRERQQAMGIDWMDTRELSQAIPPAYTEFICEQLMAHLKAKVAV